MLRTSETFWGSSKPSTANDISTEPSETLLTNSQWKSSSPPAGSKSNRKIYWSQTPSAMKEKNSYLSHKSIKIKEKAQGSESWERIKMKIMDSICRLIGKMKFLMFPRRKMSRLRPKRKKKTLRNKKIMKSSKSCVHCVRDQSVATSARESVVVPSIINALKTSIRK